MLSQFKSVIVTTLILCVLFQHSYAEEQEPIRVIIAEHCTDCHRVPGFMEENRTPQIGAPDFQEIANNPKIYSRQRLELFLQQPHFPMRQIKFSKSEIQNIIAFIENLRTPLERP